ncbi:MAG: methylated-DNA--[protein]-cysteine S-methyltransferase [bacterium]|nr:methylated-DNA--[protein]-cysteine S-methyltransferase [bacterium]
MGTTLGVRPDQQNLFGRPLPEPDQGHAHERWLARIRREVSIFASAQGVTRLCFFREEAPAPENGTGANRELSLKAIAEVEEYLNGGREMFTLPLDLYSLTPFQREVLHATLAIPYGESRSYAWVAQQTGRPKAVRAVGQALNRNPIPLLIPCHRVISSSGALGGFGSGVAVKSALLAHEKLHR